MKFIPCINLILHFILCKRMILRKTRLKIAIYIAVCGVLNHQLANNAKTEVIFG